MSIALQMPPALHSFSNDFITAEFLSADYLQQVGVKSVNFVETSQITTAGVEVLIKYGNRTITMVSAYAPDDSGFQFLCENGSAAPSYLVYEYFKANHQLSTDFEVSFLGSKIIFTAREKVAGFDFSTGNTTQGKNDIIKPNYRVFFRLYLEDAQHQNFDVVYSTYLSLYNGKPGVSIAQIGDKIHQRIETDLDLFGLEIPGLSALECKTTCRKFYFQFGESFGETITVKKLTASPIYNVIYGGLSFQAQTNKTLASLISPVTSPGDRFLKQGPKSQFTRIDQPQYLYFYNTRATKDGAKLRVKRTFSDGTSDFINLFTVSLQENRKFAFNLSAGAIYSGLKTLSEYEVYLLDGADNRISEKQIYFVKRDREKFVRYFLNHSSWGSLDSRCFTGKNQTSLEIAYQKAERILQKGYKLIDGQSKIFDKTGFRKFKAATGFNDPETVNFFDDFYLSTRHFRYIANTILPIEVLSTSIEKPIDAQFLHYSSFEYRYLFSDDQFSETDAVDNFSPTGSGLAPPSNLPVLITSGTINNPSTTIIQRQNPQ